MRSLIWTVLPALASCAVVQSSSSSMTVLLAEGTVAPSSTSMRPTVTQVVTESVSSTLTVTVTTTITTTIGSSPTATSSSTVTSSPTSSSTSPSISSSSSTSTSTSSSVSTFSTSTTTSTTTSITTSITTSSSTTTSIAPVVTDEAYIDTILRHHNVHRANHSANAMTWSSSLGDTARKIAETCVYQHNTTTDCANGPCYGQNIAAGFYPNLMGSMVSDGFYNSEVNSYTYYGSEPDYNTVKAWGHFTQIVWKGSTSVGCYTNDCTATGLSFPDGGGAGIAPFFTVCNYGPAGNIVGGFAANVGSPLGAATVHANYECPSADNCVGPTT